MKKLTAIILALMLMLTLTVTAAAESDGLDPAQRHIYQLVTEHDPEPVFHGNFTYWRWQQTIENPADGVAEGWFGVKQPCTRAQIVTMLWRLNGSPVEETPLWFSDVGGWCENAVRWAARRGITAGTGGGEFSPDAECTRAQAVTFLWKGGEE